MKVRLTESEEHQLTGEFAKFCELHREKLAKMKDNSTRMNFMQLELPHIPQYLVLRTVKPYLVKGSG